MISYSSNILQIGGDLFRIKRIFKEFQFPEDFEFDLLKKEYFVDRVFKKKGIYYLCDEINDAVIIEEENEENVK